MNMMLSQAMVQKMEISGGATNSIFPAVESVLTGSTEMYKSLEFVAARKEHGQIPMCHRFHLL